MDKKLKKLLLDFHLEAYKIWESWHVMDQRNVLDLFETSVWASIQEQDDTQLSPQVAELMAHFEGYNAVMQDYKDFQSVYNSDVKNKTIENGKILHGKRELVTEKFRALKEHIVPLRKAVEKELLELKVLK